MAEAFGRRGARVVICARNDEQLEDARRHLELMGIDATAIPCDVGKQEQVEQMIQDATAQVGRIDILVNNAGTITVGPVFTQTVEDFRDTMDSMFWGALYPTLAVLPQMQERGEGRIVNITSIGGKISVPHLLSYCSAKFAAVGLSEGLRAQLAKEGILVTTVVPGLMRTGSYMNAIFKGKHRAEYSLFSVLNNLPMTSIDASHAAEQIVEATRRGQPELTIGWQAKLLARMNGISPGVTAEVMSLADRILPRAGADRDDRWLGTESETAISESFLTSLGQEAADEYNQHPSEQRIARHRSPTSHPPA
jgi:NAD(P)-dependent dehydrogenase (short-subunit alcohol dehydrogenase family)